jgi:hypothetical protein
MSPLLLLSLLLSGLCVATAAEDPVCARLESSDLLQAILLTLAKEEQPDFTMTKGTKNRESFKLLQYNNSSLYVGIYVNKYSDVNNMPLEVGIVGKDLNKPFTRSTTALLGKLRGACAPECSLATLQLDPAWSSSLPSASSSVPALVAPVVTCERDVRIINGNNCAL